MSDYEDELDDCILDEVDDIVDIEEKLSDGEDLEYSPANQEVKFKPYNFKIYPIKWKYLEENDQSFMTEIINLLKNYCQTAGNSNTIYNQLLKFSKDRKDFINKIYEFTYNAETTNMQDAYDKIKEGICGWENSIFQKAFLDEEREIAKLLTPVEVVEGIFTCRKCKNNKTQHYSVQLRRADEPPTTFIHCVNPQCRFKWREG